MHLPECNPEVRPKVRWTESSSPGTFTYFPKIEFGVKGRLAVQYRFSLEHEEPNLLQLFLGYILAGSALHDAESE